MSRKHLSAQRAHGGDLRHYRLAVASRALAAIGGGYLLSAMAAAVLALYLPSPRVEATLTATLASFAIYTAAVVWVFAAASAGRAWLGLLLPALPLAALLLARHPAVSGT